MNSAKDPLEYFQLRPVKAAKVSEISEATAAAPVPENERINFHIGNPIQDSRLHKAYFRLTTGMDTPTPDHSSQSGSTSEELADTPDYMSFFYDTIAKCVPYLPRGGYTREKPGTLALLFKDFLNTISRDPLHYDFGEESGKRECIISAGGIHETVRVFLTAISRFSNQTPVTVFTCGFDLPGQLYDFENLDFAALPDDEKGAIVTLQHYFKSTPPRPNYMIIGRTLSETARRTLRMISLEHPLYFIETNDAPNHLSLAREAKMLNRVTRFMTPAFMNPALKNSSIIFVLGNSELLKILELVHFELKGTPSAAEVKYLAYRLMHTQAEDPEIPDPGTNTGEPVLAFENKTLPEPPAFLNRITDRMMQAYRLHSTSVERMAETYTTHSEAYLDRLQAHPHIPTSVADSFSLRTPRELFETVFTQLYDPEIESELAFNFLQRFLHHHPYYSDRDTFVVSGSARTAMSFLGFHCGIESVIIPDLSWTYEHCFPDVHTVSLNANLGIDTEGLMARLDRLMEKDPGWKHRGAVVLNSPHNASGRVFDEEALKDLLTRLLNRDIFVIDDLSYQNLRPSEQTESLPTLKQLVNERIRMGYIRKLQKRFLITIHSLSKTDCFAGGRLAVAEISHPGLHQKFATCMETVRPNSMAIFMAYLLYRNEPEQVRAFWYLRNTLLNERMTAIEEACYNLPMERNSFRIEIQRPSGSMYPQLVIHDLPPGISLDWLASNLAKRGIGLVPLSTFARTAEGFELARKTFRMTLGGKDAAEQLKAKTRRVLIDMNRLIADEQVRYNRHRFPVHSLRLKAAPYLGTGEALWTDATGRISRAAQMLFKDEFRRFSSHIRWDARAEHFLTDFLPEKMALLQQRYEDQVHLYKNILEQSVSSPSGITGILEQEFYKENTADRQQRFRRRLFDRTVHPTQMYALDVDLKTDTLLEQVFFGRRASEKETQSLALSLVHEYLGSNIAVNSIEEADELVSDLAAVIRAEEYARWNGRFNQPAFLSFWGDWDGSTRPSGQGHRLVAAALLKNVSLLAEIIRTLIKYNRDLVIPADLRREIERLDAQKTGFWNLSNKITSLTNQLEKRYRSVLPFQAPSGRLDALASKLRLARDPLTALWQHNDRLEKRMFELRRERRQSMEYYFALNKRLRKFLHSRLPEIERLLSHPEVALKAGTYRSLLRRFILTPRIHQKMILSEDPFAIDTTVHNMFEINQIASEYGNPGMVLALQVSMSTEPEALISLDSKMRARNEMLKRENPDTELPNIWLIPLFEDTETIESLTAYLDRIWNYAIRSRRVDQAAADRFSDMICELFIAGSDISQQVGQARGAVLYREAKHKAVRWLAERGLVEKVRMKLGSGEPMQRQGGYYDALSGKEPFRFNTENKTRFQTIKPSIQKSAEYARIPLMGILSTGDLRTFQSTIFERLRHLPVNELAQLLYHLHAAQIFHDNELVRASEPLLDTRLIFQERGYQELELRTTGKRDPLYNEFSELVTKNFRQILYGQDADVVGIHAISYFISRAMPALRDRPTVRPSRDVSEQRGQKIIARIAQTLPMAAHGSLLRAIGHNRAQTMILGINQLTTGLFRAMDEFSNRQSSYSDSVSLINDRILPHLHVREILHSLRLYHDREQTYLKRMERAFPPGNSCFAVLREDTDAITGFIPYFQRELIRRFGIEPSAFFENGTFNPALLPTLDPEIAVLVQKDLFNSDPQTLFRLIDGPVDPKWKEEVSRLLVIPENVRALRSQLWEVIENSVFQQVKSFVELAGAIHALSSGMGQTDLPFPADTTKVFRLGSQVADLLRGIVDDSMRQFLIAAVQYLTQVPRSMSEVPIDIIRALRDVEQIVKIEEQAFSESEQNLIRFYTTQMARICGENG